jgi:hypothetical protein
MADGIVGNLERKMVKGDEQIDFLEVFSGPNAPLSREMGTRLVRRFEAGGERAKPVLLSAVAVEVFAKGPLKRVGQ